MVRGKTTRVVSFRVPDEQYVDLKQRADRKGQPLADYVRWIIENYVGRCKGK